MHESFKKRIQEKGTNKAGYKEYTFVKAPKQEERKSDSNLAISGESKVMSRREMLRGAISAALTGVAVAGLPLEKVLKEGTQHENQSLLDAEELGSLISGLQSESSKPSDVVVEHSPEPVAQIEKLSESKYFLTEVEKYVAHYQRDIDQVMEYAQKTTKGDQQGRSRIQYVSEELLVEGVPQTIATELQSYIVGLCDVESSFNAGKESASGAKGLMQFMMATFKEHAPKEANILSLVDQIEAAKNKFQQIYRHVNSSCRHELLVIKSEFFFGDEERFEREFLTPVVINGYNAGEGTMSSMVKWFVNTYGTEAKTVGIFKEGEAVSGYDVFFTLASKGYEEKANPWYGSDASSYVLKIYGATRSLDRNGINT